MGATGQLWELFSVEKQIMGFRSRLDAAERFLTQQLDQLKALETEHAALQAQKKSLRAAIGGQEGEAARLEERIATIREKMNSAKTAKEYAAFQTELGTYKQQKSELEEGALESMGKVEDLDRRLAEVADRITERKAIATTAQGDRDGRASEIKAKLDDLGRQRDALATEVPADARVLLESLTLRLGAEAMAVIEIVDRRNHEYSCAGCMMTVPVEVVSAVLTHRLQQCPNCECILVASEALSTPPPAKGGGKKRKKSEPAGKA